MKAPGGHDPLSRWLLARPRAEILLAALCLSWFTGMTLWQARTNTPTIDEYAQVPAGLYHLETGNFDFDRKNPPLMKLLTAVPVQLAGAQIDASRGQLGGEGWAVWLYGNRFMRLNADRYFDYYFLARSVVILLGVAAGLCLWLWARTWFGPAAALVSLLLYATCPNLLAHSSLATVDLGVTAFTFAAFTALYRSAQTGSQRWTVASGALLGCALTSKYTAVFFLPLVPLFLFLARRPKNRADWIALGKALALIAFIAWLVLNAAYGFKGLPLPREWIDGILLKAADKARAQSPMYFMGHWSPHGWWCYYPVAFLTKATLPLIVLLGASIYAALKQSNLEKKTAPLYWAWAPALLLFVLFATVLKIDLGIRYVLPAFPFLILFVGAGAAMLLRRGKRERIALAILLAWQAVSCAATAPHHLGYFNEAVGGPDRGRRILLDSNVDWGQDLGRLKAYMDRKGIDRVHLAYFGHVDPKLYGIEFSLPMADPHPGLFAFSANYLGGYPHAVTYTLDDVVQEVPAGAWAWPEILNLKPIDRVGSSIYIFKADSGDFAEK